MNQQHVPDASADDQQYRQVLTGIWEECGGLPQLFVVHADVPRRTGSIVAWGIELPDGTAITCDPSGAAFGTWESPISAAAMLAGVRPLYLTCGGARIHA